MSIQCDYLLTLLSKAKHWRLLREVFYIRSQLVLNLENSTRAVLQHKEESLITRPFTMACLYYTTFLVILSIMKGASAGSVTTGNACTVTSDCADTANNVCVPTALKCLIIPTKTCTPTDDKCVNGATCAAGTTACSSCDMTKHIAATPADYCRLKVDQTCSTSTSSPTAPCLDNGECVSSTCKCKTGYVASTDKTSCRLIVDQSCSASTALCLENGECASSTCKCKTGYVTSTDKTSCTIQANSFGATCTVGGSPDACTTYDSNSECPSGTCQCKSNYYGVIGSKCGLAINAACTSSSVCLPNAECSGTSCKCKTGYTASGTAACTVTINTYGGACTGTSSTDSCVATDSNAVCNTLTNKCECKQGFTGSIGAKCSGAMGLASSLFLVLAALFIVTRLH